MLQACFTMQSVDTVFVKHVLDRGWSLVGPAESADSLAALRFRLSILARVEGRGQLPPSLRQIQDSLTLNLAEAAPHDADAQHAAALIADRDSLGTEKLESYRYRAFALDSRFRRFVK